MCKRKIECLEKEVLNLKKKVTKLEQNAINDKDNIFHWIFKAYNNNIYEKNICEFAKMVSNPIEYYVENWINKNTRLRCVRCCERDSEVGIDLLTNNTTKPIKIQVKFRTRRLYINPSRRQGKKKILRSYRSNTGYHKDEFDVIVLICPTGDSYSQMDNYEIVAIPTSEIIDKNNEEYCLKEIPRGTYNNFKGREVEVLNNFYQ